MNMEEGSMEISALHPYGSSAALGGHPPTGSASSLGVLHGSTASRGSLSGRLLGWVLEGMRLSREMDMQNHDFS